ncbi:O-antigen ligase family protein [Tardiphaga sp.]|uniref:O-antigen ligase family protein n=1 Tax=Tardiphaga sp. TaxID=1926292 RepID=UPI002603AC78|nr:O-antigen ligase family protein [Tardiphaga sp.]MDB5619400.1 hypothetical protein [Tardiphaga sp.]
MTAVTLSSFRASVWPVPGWVVALALLAGTALIGGALGSISRPLFMLGCVGVGWYAWRQGPAAHLQAALMLFAFAPFVRRVVDLTAGFDQSGLLLVGPLLAILAPAPRLWRLLEARLSPSRELWPVLIVGICVVYGTALSIMQADWMNAASGALKWIAPLVYAAALIETDKRDELVQAAAWAFLLILPAIGVYGILQYINPPDWDVYWMQYASITSAGLPLPYMVRTYSTMNSPASFATFVAVGLMIVCFARLPWLALLLTTPAAFALLLSSYRTAWISLAVGILFCLLFGATRRKAAVISIGVVVVVVLAATLTPFGESIAERVATLGEGSQDGSAQERLEEFVTLWSQWDSSAIGSGFTTTDAGTAGAMPIDGMIIACWVTMGIFFGLICLAALVWAGLNTIWTAWHDTSREAVIVGALGLGGLMQIPLANITSGEAGFFFWTFAVLSTPRLRGSVDSRR